MDQIERMDQMMDKLDNILINTELEKPYKLKYYHCGEYGYKKQIVQTKIVHPKFKILRTIKTKIKTNLNTVVYLII